jgi:small subunit ribosomal protein S21
VLDWLSLIDVLREAHGKKAEPARVFRFPVPKGPLVVEIELAETDRLDWALKQFRRRMIRSGMFKDMRRKRFYEKPSEARKAKAKAAERRRHKDRKRAMRRYDV